VVDASFKRGIEAIGTGLCKSALFDSVRRIEYPWWTYMVCDVALHAFFKRIIDGIGTCLYKSALFDPLINYLWYTYMIGFVALNAII
jgi:hypothetical protein